MGGGSATGRNYISLSNRNTKLNSYILNKDVPKVFISFHNADKAQVGLLRHQAKSPDFDLEFEDGSLKKPYRVEWRKNIVGDIKESDVLLVAIGQETYSRSAVKYEIDVAYREGKPIIGVILDRDGNHKIHQTLIDYGAPIVNWNMNEISYTLNTVAS